VAERAWGAEGQGLCSSSPVVAGGWRCLWEKQFAPAGRSLIDATRSGKMGRWPSSDARRLPSGLGVALSRSTAMIAGVILVTVVLCCGHGRTPVVNEHKRSVHDAPLRQSDHSPLPDANFSRYNRPPANPAAPVAYLNKKMQPSCRRPFLTWTVSRGNRLDLCRYPFEFSDGVPHAHADIAST
jgi:hypothetical protein